MKITDKMRLDWLLKNYTHPILIGGLWYIGGKYAVRGRKSPRAVIDAAIRAEKAGRK